MQRTLQKSASEPLRSPTSMGMGKPTVCRTTELTLPYPRQSIRKEDTPSLKLGSADKGIIRQPDCGIGK
jgi:hypothetical protein